jgi:Zn-finger protein
MSNLYRGPSTDASYQVLYHLAKRFQRKSCFRNQTIRNKNCLWWPCLLTDQNGMSDSLREPSIDASYQVSVYLAMLCQRRRFLEIDQSEKKNCLWWPCLLTDWDKMSNLYKRTFHRCFLPSFGSFGHAVSEEKIFRNRPIRNKNRLWWPCLLMDMGQNEQSL